MKCVCYTLRQRIVDEVLLRAGVGQAFGVSLHLSAKARGQNWNGREFWHVLTRSDGAPVIASMDHDAIRAAARLLQIPL